MAKPVVAQSGATGSVAIIFTFFALVISGCVLILYLHYLNKKGVQELQFSPLAKLVAFIVERVVLELISFVFAFFGVIGLFTTDWGSLNMTAVTIFFILFAIVKYVHLIGNAILDYKYPLEKKIWTAEKMLRPDWPELVDAFIFFPVIIIDGKILNAEYVTGIKGAFFDYDTSILFVLDVFLYVKLMVGIVCRVHHVNGRYDLKAIAWAVFSMSYTISLIFAYIVAHLSGISDSGMSLTPMLAFLLLVLVTHNYVASYTSLCAQNIIALDRALKGTGSGRLGQMIIFLNYFKQNTRATAISIVLFLYTFSLYTGVVVITIVLLTRDVRPEPAVQGAFVLSLVVLLLTNLTLLGNLVYATAKRVGSRYDVKPIKFGSKEVSLDCHTYADVMQKGLIDCQANFTVNRHMQIT